MGDELSNDTMSDEPLLQQELLFHTYTKKKSKRDEQIPEMVLLSFVRNECNKFLRL
jgi:hypothetical protein